MLIEIYCGEKLYARLDMDFAAKKMNVLAGQDRSVQFIDRIFQYADGYRFDFRTVGIYLKNRGVTQDSSPGVYENIDDDVKIVVS